MVRTKKPQRGFTLVELLVVIGIIAVLIGILLPVIGRARKQANTTACMAALRSLGQTLAIYTSENKGSYPFSYYTSTAPAGGVTAEGDSNAAVYVWWSVLRSYMRKGGGPDNSIVDANGNETSSRFMKAFACPEGHNPDAGCDFASNMVIMPEVNWDGAFGAANSNYNLRAFGIKPLKVTQVYYDNILLYDATELVDTDFSRQYVSSYDLDKDGPPYGGAAGGSFANAKKAYLRYRPMADIPGNYPMPGPLMNDQPINPGANQDAVTSKSDGEKGNIRWRHGKEDQANFLFADGTVRTMKITTGKYGQANFHGEVLHKYFRPKAPQGFTANP
jgi:prepilin-type N-terminal cleavage/methylation domain-containing protein/prepilin-type processing-associated H-X9-DG protein